MWKNNDSKFICQGHGLMNTIIKHEQGKGIEYIKKFDTKTNSFKRISKKDILSYFSWDTEPHLFLKAHSYFSNCK